VQNERDQGKVFHMTQEDVRAASDMVAGMLQMNDYQMHVCLILVPLTPL
jgi:hypothetical protein